MTEPTALDLANAATRKAIADKFRQQYLDALALAEQVLGPGWEPTGRHYLYDKEDEDACRHSGKQPTPVATVITCQNEAGEKRHFRADGEPRECSTVEEGFGAMLFEPHPTKRFTWAGKEIAPHRFSLCWGWFEPDYRPASAEKLAEMRQRREDKAEQKAVAEIDALAAGSLFPEWVKQVGMEDLEAKKRGRKR